MWPAKFFQKIGFDVGRLFFETPCSFFFVDFELIFSRRVRYTYPAIFKTLSNIYDGPFFEYGQWFLAVPSRQLHVES